MAMATAKHRGLWLLLGSTLQMGDSCSGWMMQNNYSLSGVEPQGFQQGMVRALHDPSFCQRRPSLFVKGFLSILLRESYPFCEGFPILLVKDVLSFLLRVSYLILFFYGFRLLTIVIGLLPNPLMKYSTYEISMPKTSSLLKG